MNQENKIAVYTCVAVVVTWVLSGLLLYCIPERGTFGDMFGAINALFSGLAFVGVVYAILLQRKELQLQRLELEETRKELSRSAKAQEDSQAALALQAEMAKQTYKLNALSSAFDTNQQLIDRYLKNQTGDPEGYAIYERSNQRKTHIGAALDSLIDKLLTDNA